MPLYFSIFFFLRKKNFVTRVGCLTTEQKTQKSIAECPPLKCQPRQKSYVELTVKSILEVIFIS